MWFAVAKTCSSCSFTGSVMCMLDQVKTTGSSCTAVQPDNFACLVLPLWTDIYSTGGSSVAPVPGEAPPTRNPLFASGAAAAAGAAGGAALAAHAIEPTPSPAATPHTGSGTQSEPG